MSIERQRCTIAHEIKHVVYREDNPTEKEETLANHFARVLLAPSCLVMFFKDKFNFYELFSIDEKHKDSIISILDRIEEADEEGKSLSQEDLLLMLKKLSLNEEW